MLNEGRPVQTMLVANTADRPIQVGSHFHFFEVNRALLQAGEVQRPGEPEVGQSPHVLSSSRARGSDH